MPLVGRPFVLEYTRILWLRLRGRRSGLMTRRPAARPGA